MNLALRIGKYSQQQHISHLQLLNRLALLNEQYIRCTYEHFVEKNASNYIRKIFLSVEAANEKLTNSVTTASTLFRQSILTKEEMAEEQSTYRKTPSGIVGYLNKRSKTWKNKWMRRWFHVEGKASSTQKEKINTIDFKNLILLLHLLGQPEMLIEIFVLS